ncbi:MAG TPA: Rrf2 family transcriptional regulator [Terriglobia bacterium]|nr:Rrf2 family transcriptional regulator [Terriglobia bacterium]
MKVSSQEEYGLRCLLRIAREGPSGSLTIPEISKGEGISISYAAKLLRMLRRGGFLTSARGQTGGYRLSRPAQEMNVGHVLALLGGRLFESEFCDHHAGVAQVCTHSVDCSMRSLWHAVQMVVDRVLDKTTLKDLLSSEQEMTAWIFPLIQFNNEQSLRLPIEIPHRAR